MSRFLHRNNKDNAGVMVFSLNKSRQVTANTVNLFHLHFNDIHNCDHRYIHKKGLFTNFYLHFILMISELTIIIWPQNFRKFSSTKYVI